MSIGNEIIRTKLGFKVSFLDIKFY